MTLASNGTHPVLIEQDVVLAAGVRPADGVADGDLHGRRRVLQAGRAADDDVCGARGGVRERRDREDPQEHEQAQRPHAGILPRPGARGQLGSRPHSRRVRASGTATR